MKGIYLVAVVALAGIALNEPSVEAAPPTRCPIIDPKDKTIHLAHRICTKFYKCFMGNPIEMDCPFMDKRGNRLHFNPEKQVCDWPWSAGCKGGTITTEETTEETTPEPTTKTTPPLRPWDCPTDTDGLTIHLPHETYCDHFYLCTDGEKEDVRCPNRKLFNRDTRSCDSPRNVRCEGTSITPRTITPTAPTTKRPLKECPTTGTDYVPHECQCDKYYRCEDGVMILMRCPRGLHYDYINKYCDFPDIVKCVRPIPDSAAASATTALYNECLTEQENRKLQHESICSAYYECADGGKVLKYCTAGLHFNVTLQTCEYPEKECSLTTPPHTIPTSSPAFICPPRSHLKKARLPHECSCTKYYECFNGLQVRSNCPAGSHYDYVRQVCDEPEIVKCVRPIPVLPRE